MVLTWDKYFKQAYRAGRLIHAELKEGQVMKEKEGAGE